MYDSLFAVEVLAVYKMSHAQENLSLGFLTRSYTNRVVQPQKLARGLKFSI